MGSKGSNQTTSSSSPDPQAYALYSQLLSRAQGVSNTPYTPYSGQTVAPINAQQQTGIANINANANYAQPYLGTALQYAQNAAQPITAQQIQQYESPYTQQVVQATQNQFNNQNAQQQQQVLGNAAMQGALGGNRVGIAQAELANQQNLAQAPVIANLQNQGYTTGLNTALTEQQALASGAANIGSLGIAGQNAGLTGANAQIGAGTLQQGTQQALDASQYQQFMQQQAYPFQTAQWLAGIGTGVGSQLGGTSQTTGPAPNPFTQYLGAGLSGAGLLGQSGAFGAAGWLLSDEKVKENIERIGKLNDGQHIYRFNYKGDPTTHVGLIAQDVEKHHPEAVGDINGIKAVDYHAATQDAAQGVANRDVGGGVTSGTPYDSGSMGVVPYSGGKNWIPGAQITPGRGAPPPPQIHQPTGGAPDLASQGKNLGMLASAIKQGFNAPSGITNIPNSPSAGIYTGDPTQAGFGPTLDRGQMGGAGLSASADNPSPYSAGGTVGLAPGANFAVGGAPKDEFGPTMAGDATTGIAPETPPQPKQPEGVTLPPDLNTNNPFKPQPDTKFPYPGGVEPPPPQLPGKIETASGPSKAQVQHALYGQESNYGRNPSTSVTGARGPMQIQPATFAAHARPGEDINNSEHNIAVGNRISDSYYDKYGGDPARVAVAYFSGPGNVAPPGSPTPWLHNRRDPNGKSVASYVSDVLKRIPGDASAPAIGGEPPVGVSAPPTEVAAASGEPKPVGVAGEPLPPNATDPSIEVLAQSRAKPEGVAGAPAPESKGLNLGADSKLWPSLMSAGFGMLASHSPFRGVGIGEGAQQGLGTYNDLVKQENVQKMSQAKLDMEAKKLSTEADRHQRDYELNVHKADTSEKHQKELLDQQRQIAADRTKMEALRLQETTHQNADRTKMEALKLQETARQHDLSLKTPVKYGETRSGQPLYALPKPGPDGVEYWPIDPKTGQIGPSPLGGGLPSASGMNGQQPQQQGKPGFQTAAMTEDQAVSAAPPVETRAQAPAASKEARNDAYLKYLADDIGGSEGARYAATLKGVADYKINPSALFSLRGNRREHAMGDVMLYDPTYDQRRYAQTNRAISGWAQSPEGRSTRALSVVVEHLGTAEELGKALQNGDVQAINSMKNAIKSQFGYEGPVNFNFAKQIVADEIAKAVIGGQNGEADRQGLQKALSAANSPEQLEGIVHTAKELMAGQLVGLQHTYHWATGLNNFEEQLTPRAQKEVGALMVERANKMDASQRKVLDNPQSKAALEWANAHLSDADPAMAKKAAEIKKRLGL